MENGKIGHVFFIFLLLKLLILPNFYHLEIEEIKVIVSLRISFDDC